MISGNLFGFDMFKNTDFGILWRIQFWFGQSMILTSFVLSTMVRTMDQATNIAYGVILILIILAIFFANSDLILLLFYSERSINAGLGYIS